MLLSTSAIVKWNSKNKKHFVDLGYEFTFMRDTFEVDVNHLNHASSSIVSVRCDYCNRVYDIAWCKYVNNHANGSVMDACYDCKWIKGRDSMERKYGTRKIRSIPGVEEKLRATNLEKYGCENPFGNEGVKDKIRETCLLKYGVTNYTMTEEYLVKTRETSLEKYGVTSWMKLDKYAEMFRGANSPVWKGGVARGRNERATYDYRAWREDVFERDLYTCQKCHSRNGNGYAVVLNAHHIFNWRDNEGLRYDINNGITLCDGCHTQFHSIFGKRNNTAAQMELFLCQDEKVC